jgi:uncharacterized protein YegP (UPF0339 family)
MNGKLWEHDLYRVKTDGTDNSKTGEYVWFLTIKNNKIYYVTTGYARKIMNLDGTGIRDIKGNLVDLAYFDFYDNGIFYKSFEDGNTSYLKGTIYKANNDGNNKIKVLDETAFEGELTELNINNDWLYFLNHPNEDSSWILYKVKIDGTQITKLMDLDVRFAPGFEDPVVLGDWLYLTNYDDDNKLYRIKIDGTIKEKLSDEKLTKYEVDKDGIYFENEHDSSIYLYKVSLDGSVKSKPLEFDEVYLGD